MELIERIEIHNEAWKIETFRADWLEDESGDDAVALASAAADLQYAWLVNETGNHIKGWTYRNGVFAGPIDGFVDRNFVALLLSLHTESVDYVCDHLEELRAELAAAASEPFEVRTDQLDEYVPLGSNPGAPTHESVYVDDAGAEQWGTLVALRGSATQGVDYDLRTADGATVTLQSCFRDTMIKVRAIRA